MSLEIRVPFPTQIASTRKVRLAALHRRTSTRCSVAFACVVSCVRNFQPWWAHKSVSVLPSDEVEGERARACEYAPLSRDRVEFTLHQWDQWHEKMQWTYGSGSENVILKSEFRRFRLRSPTNLRIVESFACVGLKPRPKSSRIALAASGILDHGCRC